MAPTPSYPSPQLLLAHRTAVRATVAACGVPKREVDDVTSTCLVAAWGAIQRGEFRLHAWVEPAEALRRWLYGIAWRLSSHERGRACHRREVLSGEPWELSPEEPAIDAEAQIRARAGLRALMRLRPKQQELLLAVASGETATELAVPLGVTPRAVLQQLARARRDLREEMEPGEADEVEEADDNVNNVNDVDEADESDGTDEADETDETDETDEAGEVEGADEPSP